MPDGVAVGSWVTEIAPGRTAFYDIDTPVTLARLDRGEAEYISASLLPRYDLYLSFTGGPTLDLLARRFGAKRARPLYCSVDPEVHYPEASPRRWDLGYLGTYSADRQPALDRLLIEPARRLPSLRFAVAGPQYPAQLVWPGNVDRNEHIAPGDHRAFYGAQRFTLNVTRRDMALAGWSPSVRLFEAAACGIPVISDAWPGLDAFFAPEHEILVARTPEDTMRFLRDLSEQDRHAIGQRARARVLAAHTAAHRAEALAEYTTELLEKAPARAPRA
ncbi:MAG: glycosyltransferase [Minicystis sp.]